MRRGKSQSLTNCADGFEVCVSFADLSQGAAVLTKYVDAVCTAGDED